MFTENANRAVTGGVIAPDNFQPNPKNPIIAAFFRNIGLADELGSGVRKLYHYVPRYSGKPPQMIDGDVFRVIVPLDDAYSFEASITNSITTNDTTNITINETQKKILLMIGENPKITAKELSEKVGITERNIKSNIKILKDIGMLEREGATKNGRWVVTKQ
jgi:ATP-dependent DNA helicase RecG